MLLPSASTAPRRAAPLDGTSQVITSGETPRSSSSGRLDVGRAVRVADAEGAGLGGETMPFWKLRRLVSAGDVPSSEVNGTKDEDVGVYNGLMLFGEEGGVTTGASRSPIFEWKRSERAGVTARRQR